jgi:hypothetical protein
MINPTINEPAPKAIFHKNRLYAKSPLFNWEAVLRVHSKHKSSESDNNNLNDEYAQYDNIEKGMFGYSFEDINLNSNKNTS